jgi:hypothetical protein
VSKHEPRKDRWTQNSSREHRSAFGVVQFRQGAWEGEVHYELQDEATGEWLPQSASAGRFKRPRNAMISVEDKATEIRRRYGERVRIAFGG